MLGESQADLGYPTRWMMECDAARYNVSPSSRQGSSVEIDNNMAEKRERDGTFSTDAYCNSYSIYISSI